jgi:MFS transporter, AAHS family, 4-hydroxybenzoate transporter
MSISAANRSPTVDVISLIEEASWRPYHTWLIVLTALTIVFDGVDIQLLGIVVPTIMKEWGVSRGAFAPVLSASSLGMMIGGAVGGIAGDRFGRRTALLSSVAFFGVMTIAAGLTGTVGSLGWLRLAAGLGLGGALPNAASLAAEYVPRARRPVAVTSTIVCIPLGATLAGLLGIRALPMLGWRGLFVLGGAIPVAIAVSLWMLIPESPSYLAARKQRWPDLRQFLRRIGQQMDDSATPNLVNVDRGSRSRMSLAGILQPDLRRDTFALWTAYFSCLLSVYLGFSWLTSLLVSAGFSESVASQGITAFNLGGVIGALGGASLISRVGSRRAMLFMTAGAIAGALGLAATPIAPKTGVVVVLALLTLTGGLINAVQTTMYALGTHVYPTHVRATGVGTAVGIGRVGAITAGFAGAWVLSSGSSSFFILMAAAMSVCFLALASIHRHVPPINIKSSA